MKRKPLTPPPRVTPVPSLERTLRRLRYLTKEAVTPAYHEYKAMSPHERERLARLTLTPAQLKWGSPQNIHLACINALAQDEPTEATT